MWKSCFISYRHEDTGWAALWLFDNLSFTFGVESTFFDAGRLRVGQKWKEELTAHLHKSDILIAMIGRQWLDIKGKDGKRRLENPNDVVRYEIKTAIERDTSLVPLLVDGVACPARKDVPPDLKGLFDWQAMSLRRHRAHHDQQELLDYLRGDPVRIRASARKVTEDPASGLLLPVPLTIEGLARAVEPALATTIWTRWRNGEAIILHSNIFGRRGSLLFDEVKRRVANDDGLRQRIEVFLEKLETLDNERRRGAGAPLSVHETAAGRAYILLALAVGRI